jgi:hypothetical protein
VTATITGVVAAGATRILVSSHEGFEVGAGLVIDAGTPFEERNKIKGFGSILLETPTQFEHASGATVSANSSSHQYLLKIQNGKLVINRLENSTWVKGSGTIVRFEDDAEEENGFPVAALVVIAAIVAVLTGLGLVAVAFFCCKRRAHSNSPAGERQFNDNACNMAVGSDLEQAQTPKLLGALQGSSSSIFKKSRDNLGASNLEGETSNLENDLVIAQEYSHEQLALSSKSSEDSHEQPELSSKKSEDSREQLESSPKKSRDIELAGQSRTSIGAADRYMDLYVEEGDTFELTIASI